MKISTLLVLPVLLILLAIIPAFPRAFAAPSNITLAPLAYRGTTTLSFASGTESPGIRAELAAATPEASPKASTTSNIASVPSPPPTPISSGNPNLAVGFNGLSHRDQRLAGTGRYANTQFSTEPPDQGLCVGGNFVLETVNTALQVFNKQGVALTSPTAINQFFGLAPAIIRSNPLVFGDDAGDPKCYFDPQTGRFFLTVFQIDIVASSGALGNRAHTEIAVSKTSDPTGRWNIYSLDVTDDGTNGTPSHTGCPCFGDQPLIGADSNGFYISTNEFSLHPFGAVFDGAQIYAMSKTALAKGVLPKVVHIDTGPIPTPPPDAAGGAIWYSVQPATTPSGDNYASNFGGTEFFLSALDFFGTTDNRIAVWALTNTKSLNSVSPSVSLSVNTIQSESYGTPNPAVQKSGPTPLGDAVGNPLELINSNDDRMNQVVYATGLLWAGVNTNITRGNVVTVGIAYFIVSPRVTSPTSVTGRIVNQGYVAPQGESVLFPSVGVSSDGTAVIAFTLVGPDFFPSSAYATLTTNGVGRIRIAALGSAPEDGFTGYAAFGFNGVARWGDYTAAVGDNAGHVWIASEYIPNAPRTVNANWGTFVAQIDLSMQ